MTHLAMHHNPHMPQSHNSLINLLPGSLLCWIDGTWRRSRAALIIPFYAISFIYAPMCIAQSKAAIDSHVAAAVTAFNQLDTRHPTLLAEAAGVLIFPQVIKGGVALSNEFGEGVLQIQGKTVGYYSITSVSVGLTAGMQSHSTIVAFMTPQSLAAFKSGHGWSVGGENSIVLLTKGASGDYDSNTLKKPILGFIFAEEGLMADASIEGSKITRLNK